MSKGPAELGPLAPEDQGRTKGSGARADDQEGAVPLPRRAPQTMFNARSTPAKTSGGAIEDHQAKGTRGRQFFGRPGRLSRLLGANEEETILLGKPRPIRRLETPPAIDDRHPSPLEHPVMNNGAQERGLPDPGRPYPGRNRAER